MAFGTAIRKALDAGSTAFGFWLTLPTAAGAKTILGGSPGSFSWVLVDAEHGLINDSHYYELVNAIAAAGASPIIRVPWAEEWLIKRALDSGAHGILTPMCHTPDDAARIVKYTKYPPVGSRGYGPAFAIHSVSAQEYDSEADQGLLVSVQIESRSGVDNVEEIAKVEGLDVLLIGPFDLAKQMNVTRGGDEHEATIQRILKAARSAGKKAAIFCTDGDDARRRIEQGFDMVSIITDTSVLADGFARELQAAKGKEVSRQPGQGY